MPRSADRFRPARRLGCQARICGDLVIDVPPESQVHRQVIRKRAETHPIEIDPVVRLYYVEVAEPDMHEPASDLRRLEQALREQWGLAETHADLATLAGLQKALRAGQWKVTVALRKGRDIVVHHAGLRRARLRRRDRCRLDHHRRPPHRSHERRGRRSGRGDEPANPLRRRPDEPRLLRDDEPGRRQGADARGARGDGRADWRSRARGRSRTRRNPGSDAGRQPDHASSRAWPRPDRARRGAVRACPRRGLRSARARTRPRRCARRLCLRAALHRRPCRRRHRRGRARRGPAPQGRTDPSGRCRHQRRDRVRQSRAAVRLLIADRPGVRGGADLLRPARGAGRDRARADRPR